MDIRRYLPVTAQTTSPTTEVNDEIVPNPLIEETIPMYLDDFIEIYAYLLENQCKQTALDEIELSKKGLKPKPLSIFDSESIPSLSILDYLNRFKKYNDIASDTTYVLSIIYIHRALQTGLLSVRYTNIHRLVLSCILMAVKFLDDKYYKNSFFAEIGGISTKELNELEIEILFVLNFNLNVSTDLYKQTILAIYKVYKDKTEAEAKTAAIVSPRAPNSSTETDAKTKTAATALPQVPKSSQAIDKKRNASISKPKPKPELLSFFSESKNHLPRVAVNSTATAAAVAPPQVPNAPMPKTSDQKDQKTVAFKK